MGESVKGIYDQMLSHVFNTLYGERKIIFWITIMVIIFFKALLLRQYESPALFPYEAFIFVLLMFIESYMLCSHYEMKDLSSRIIFLMCSPGAGVIVWWLSSNIWTVPDMQWFIEKVKCTSRLNWIPLMCQWENMMPSLYFIGYFVSGIYLFLCVFKAALCFVNSKSPFFEISKLDATFNYAAFMIIFAKSNLAFWFISYLFSLLE